VQKGHQGHLERTTVDSAAGSWCLQVAHTVDTAGRPMYHMTFQHGAATLHCGHCSRADDSGSMPVITKTAFI